MLVDTPLYRRAAFVPTVDVDPALDVGNFAIGPDAIPWKTEDGEIHAICDFEAGLPRVLLPRIGILRVVNEAGHVHGVVADPAKIPLIEEVYYRFALPMILQAAGAEMLHASAIRGANGVIAFCGPSGTGKSTLAYTLSRTKYQHWADDSVVFVPQERAFQAFRLPFRPRVEIAAPSSVHFQAGTEIAPLLAIAILQRHPGGFVDASDFHAEVQRFSSAEAFRSILPHIFSFILADRKRNALMMARYFDLAAQVPMFDVRFTPCIEALPKLCETIETYCLSSVLSCNR